MPFDPNTASILGSATKTSFDPTTASPLNDQAGTGRVVASTNNKATTGSGEALNSISDKSTENTGNLPAAIIGGVSSGVADIAETAAHGAYWALEKAGIISPEKALKAKTEATKDVNKWLRADENTTTNDIFSKSYRKYPAVSAVSRAVPDVYFAYKAMPPAVKAADGAGIVGKLGTGLLNTALQSGSAAVINAGLSGTDTENQDTAAMIGAAIPPIASLVGKGIKYGAKLKSSLADLADQVSVSNKQLILDGSVSPEGKMAQSISNYVTKAKEIENQNYESIKALPGGVNTTKLKGIITNILNASGSKIKNKEWIHDNSSILRTNPKAINALEEIGIEANNAKTMEDAINLKQLISSKSNLFTKKNVTSNINTQYQTLRQEIDNQIANKANEAGLTDQWKQANQFHSKIIAPLNDAGKIDIANAFNKRETNSQEFANETRNLLTKAMKNPRDMKALLFGTDINGERIVINAALKNILDDASVAPTNFNPNNALLKLNKFISIHKSDLSKDSLDILNGAKKLLKYTGAIPKAGSNNTLNSGYSQHFAGAFAGGTLGSMAGPIGAGVGATAGIVATPLIIKGLNSLLDSPYGMAVLSGIAKNKPWANMLGRGIKAGVSLAPGAVNKANSSTDSQENPSNAN